mmetsp:Transcript_1122/g.1807  ORF Transcript_1122/g.1807 Transcript_1122/m.1807 type:complete len:218 (-) Transcript_1122:586-1239(-)
MKYFYFFFTRESKNFHLNVNSIASILNIDKSKIGILNLIEKSIEKENLFLLNIKDIINQEEIDKTLFNHNSSYASTILNLIKSNFPIFLKMIFDRFENYDIVVFNLPIQSELLNSLHIYKILSDHLTSLKIKIFVINIFFVSEFMNFHKLLTILLHNALQLYTLKIKPKNLVFENEASKLHNVVLLETNQVKKIIYYILINSTEKPINKKDIFTGIV